MPRYIIERAVPHAGELTTRDLKAIAEQGLLVQRKLKGQVQWIQSIFTADKMICLYVADRKCVIREHALQSGLPIRTITRVTAIIGPQWLP